MIVVIVPSSPLNAQSSFRSDHDGFLTMRLSLPWWHNFGNHALGGKNVFELVGVATEKKHLLNSLEYRNTSGTRELLDSGTEKLSLEIKSQDRSEWKGRKVSKITLFCYRFWLPSSLFVKPDCVRKILIAFFCYHFKCFAVLLPSIKSDLNWSKQNCRKGFQLNMIPVISSS